MDVIKISAYIAWSVIIASIYYKSQNFPTPFSDSLSFNQRQLMKSSFPNMKKMGCSTLFLPFIFFILTSKRENSITTLSAYLAWSMILSTLFIKMKMSKRDPAFTDSLTSYQLMLKAESSKVRGNAFTKGFVVSLLFFLIVNR
tara:strand:+ start:479 stop:907 length:429 start_codon:yes stop_codon:yes gene_type:complete